jgi:5'(3')-deoxyribonucleotidase
MAEQVRQETGRDYVIAEDLEKYGDGASDAAREYMYYLVEDDREFWAQLPWMGGGQELWKHISQYEPSILTSPMDKKGKKGSLLGKLDWLNKNLGLDTNREVIFAHNKYEYATEKDGTENILIDDFLTKIEPWRIAGGKGIWHQGNTSQTIATLEEARDVSTN